MKNIKMTIKHFALTSLVLLVLTSCDKEYASLDTDIINNENADNFSTDNLDYPVITHTKKYSPFTANQLSSNILGYYKHSIFGNSTANVVAQVNTNRLNPVFGENVELDSVVLTIPYFSRVAEIVDNASIYKLDSVYGNTPIKLSIYKNNYYLRDFDPEQEFTDSRRYFSDRTTSDVNSISQFELEGELLYYNEAFLPSNGQISLTEINYELEEPAPEVTSTLSPSFRVKLDKPNDNEGDLSEFWNTLLFNMEGSNELSNSNNFTDYFRGLYFKVEPTDVDGTMMLLDFSNPASNLTVYYKNAFDEEDTDNDGIPNYADVDVDGNNENDNGNDSDADGINNDFDVDSTEGIDINEDGIDDNVQPETGTFQMTFSGNVVNIIENENFNVIDGDATNGDELLYLKGGEGSIAIVNLFNGDENGNSTPLEDFRSKNWLINEANLIFYVDQSQLLEDEPNRLFLYDLENNTPIIDYYLDQSSDASTGEVIINHLGQLEREGEENNGQGKQYKIRITEHLNNIFKKDSTNVKLGLFVSSGVGLNSTENLQLKDYNENDTSFQIKNIISGAALSPKGTILHGSNATDPSKRVKLQVYYTEPNEQ